VVEDGQVYLVEVVEEVVVAAPNKKSADELSDEIVDKLEKMNQRLKILSDKASDSKLELLNNKQKEHLKKQVGRSERANKKLKESKAFKETGKREKHKEKKPSPDANIDLMAPQFADNSDDDLYDTEELADFSSMIDDMNSIMDDTEQELDRRLLIADLQQQAAIMLSNGQNPDNVYIKLENLLKQSPVTEGHYVGYKIVKLSAVLAQGAFDISTCVTRQTSAGWNVSWAGIIFASINGGLEIIAESLDWKITYDEGQLAEQSYQCITKMGYEHAQMGGDLKSINGQVVQIQADANSMGDSLDLVLTQLDETDGKVDELVTTTDRIEDKVDTLTAKVDAMNAQMNKRFDAMEAMLIKRLDNVDQLLSTPHGIRPKLPKE
jgi:hypothetical protein